eukprot:gene1686-1879_t
MLRKADTALQDDARDALLARQFMKGLPSDIRLRLLESNPTPSLHDMTSFVQRFRAIHHPDVASSQHVHAVQSASHAVSPSHDDSLAALINQLTATVAALAADQKELRAAFTPPLTGKSDTSFKCTSCLVDTKWKTFTSFIAS